MPMDVRRVEDRFVIAFDVPGVDPGSIDVSVDGQTVTVQAERSRPEDDGQWLVAERPHGRFSRQLTLGRDLDTGALHASYADGVLTVTIPVAEKAKPRRIEVEHHGGQASITSGSTT
jgi:HSP20 family protein